jgi:hypothetical protein
MAPAERKNVQTTYYMISFTISDKELDVYGRSPEQLSLELLVLKLRGANTTFETGIAM